MSAGNLTGRDEATHLGTSKSSDVTTPGHSKRASIGAERPADKIPGDGKERDAGKPAEHMAPELRDREGFVNGKNKEQKEIKEGKRPSGISSTFGKVILDGIDQIVAGAKAVAVEVGEALVQEAQAQREQLEQAKSEVDRASMIELVKQAHEARAPVRYESSGWGGLATHIGKHPAVTLLEGKSQAEREVFKEVFKRQFGVSVEEHFGQQPGGNRVLRLLARQDASFKEIPSDKQDEIFRKAEALEKAVAQADPLGRANVDKTTVFSVLEKLEPVERKALAVAYGEVTGKDLEDVLRDRLSGSEEERAVNYLKYGSTDVVGQLHLALTKDHDQDLRDSLRTMSSTQISELEREFQARYGKSLRESIMRDGGLSDTTKQMLSIYLKGADKRSPEDWEMLLNMALSANLKEIENRRQWGGAYSDMPMDSGDLKLVAEVMSSKVLPAEFRQHWLENGGREKLEKAFPLHKKQALDYARHGFLTTATKIELNTDSGLFGNDDEDGIERALAEMSDEERALYLKGARLDQELGSVDLFTAMQRRDALSAEDRRALKYFHHLNDRIGSPANGDEYEKWTDMAIRPGGRDKAIQELKNISEADWKLLHDPDTRDAQIEKLLKEKNIDLMSVTAWKQAREILRQMGEADTFEDRNCAGSPPIAKVIAETTAADPAAGLYILGRDKLAMIAALAPGRISFYVEHERVFDALQSMNVDDRKKYRQDEKFRQSVDRWVALALQGQPAHLEAAMSLLEKIREGKAPRADFIDQINIEAGNDETNEARVIRLIDYEFRSSEAVGEKPSLRQRLINPQSDADKALKARFERAIHRALEDDEYKQYALPLLENGHVSLEFMMSIHKQEDHGGRKRFEEITAVLAAKDPVSQAERQRFVFDPEYQRRVLEYLPAADKAVALAVLTQGKMKPEDITRAFVLGLGPSKQDVMQMHEGLSAEENEKFRSEYARKYGSDVLQDLASKLTGKDEKLALREVRRDARTAQEAFYDARQDAHAARSGWGSDFTDGFTGIGHMVDNAVTQMGAAVEQAAVTGKELSREEIKKLQENIYANTELFVQSKQAVADALADIVITGVSIAIPGGMTLRLLAFSAGGGLGKVAMKAAVMGENYDGNVLKDFASGFADTALSALGPGQVARLAGLGKKVAGDAGQRVAASAIGKQTIKEGGEAVLENELRSLAARAVSSGALDITDDTLARVVNKVARKEATDAEKAALRDAIKAEFEAGIKSEIKTGFRKYLTERALDTVGGVVGGSGGGLVRGIFEWDPEKTFSENLHDVISRAALSGAFGAGGALAFSTAFKAAGASWRILRRPDMPQTRDAVELQVLVREGDFAVVRAADAPAVGGQTIKVPPDRVGAEFQSVGQSDCYVDKNGHILKKVAEGPDGSLGLQRDEHAAIAVREETAAFVEGTSAKAGERGTAQPGNMLTVKSSEGQDRAAVAGEIDSTGRKPHSRRQPETRMRRPVDQALPGNDVVARGQLRQRARVEGRNFKKAPEANSKGELVEADGGTKITYEVDGKRYKLERDASKSPDKPRGDAYYYPVPRGKGPLSDVKVHVTALDGPDLARLQEVLIPALHEDPILRQYVRTWKTLDPRFGTGASDAYGVQPSGTNQGAKGFTVYARTDKDTEMILNRIDEILAGHPELRLDKPADTGNVDVIPGNSRTNRVSRVRDHFEVSPDNASEKAPLLKLHDVVRARAHAEFGVAPDGQLLPSQLAELERRTGIAPGTLAYDSHGNLVLKTTERSDVSRHGEVYAMEAGVSKQHGSKTDRPAVYALHQHYGIDPAALVEFKVKTDEALSPSQLRDLEKQLGMEPNSLGYANGKLVYSRRGGVPEAVADKHTQAQISERGETPPAPKRGDEVVFNREQFEVLGFDGQTGDAIIFRQGRKASANIARRVSPQELGGKYRAFQIGGQTRYRDHDGNFYKLLERPEGRYLLPDGQLLAVRPGDLRPDASMADRNAQGRAMHRAVLAPSVGPPASVQNVPPPVGPVLQRRK